MLANKRHSDVEPWSGASPPPRPIKWTEVFLLRFAVWISCGAVVFVADAATKAAPHPLVVYNHSHTPAVVLFLVAVLLLALGLLYSNLLAFGAGLMFGGLCGNGGELLHYGYASDWIHIGHYLTNVADLCGAAGLLCCFAGYLLPRRR